MKIISHRGYWKSDVEKNSIAAFKRSFLLGYGTETDVRDYKGELVISHDMANGCEESLSSFLATANDALRCASNRSLTLALNVKADGLAVAMRKHLDKHSELDAFVFDMSIPDMRSYFDQGIPVFTRMSEVEPHPVWFELSAGVWLDGFSSEWYDISEIERVLEMGKRVCIVSPELHKRQHLSLWEKIRPLAIASRSDLMLCTDLPEDATSFFCCQN